ncbi:unnamed protein product [Caenorhabditis bovis]|uniref:RRP15-like protein n=1 Tax=Caenorhabditis bovis TaxID=2654633 RepID=A0A8S1EA15_9PELO|nr:unnamed protein product [Caenorhabditis bovis]
MAVRGQDRLIITEDDSDNEREISDVEEDSDDEGVEGTSAHSLNAEETVEFPAIQKKKKVVKKLTRKEQSLKRSLREYRIKLALIKPDITTNREKERILRRTATKGVVQLFNAVADRQKTMSEAVKNKMSAKERKEARERFDGRNFDPEKFADYGYGNPKTEVKNEEDENMEIGEEQIDDTNYSDED